MEAYKFKKSLQIVGREGIDQNPEKKLRLWTMKGLLGVPTIMKNKHQKKHEEGSPPPEITDIKDICCLHPFQNKVKKQQQMPNFGPILAHGFFCFPPQQVFLNNPELQRRILDAF